MSRRLAGMSGSSCLISEAFHIFAHRCEGDVIWAETYPTAEREMRWEIKVTFYLGASPRGLSAGWDHQQHPRLPLPPTPPPLSSTLSLWFHEGWAPIPALWNNMLLPSTKEHTQTFNVYTYSTYRHLHWDNVFVGKYVNFPISGEITRKTMLSVFRTTLGPSS